MLKEKDALKFGLWTPKTLDIVTIVGATNAHARGLGTAGAQLDSGLGLELTSMDEGENLLTKRFFCAAQTGGTPEPTMLSYVLFNLQLMETTSPVVVGAVGQLPTLTRAVLLLFHPENRSAGIKYSKAHLAFR
ncbi:hypothetical protein T265_07129 [Opisthorchis viverrini]|uniref:Uncharacterized protein n=1 Tax=Opisthorchis viverrini TaxID=6198 RepID=A0A074ZE49_OPIVI|nr:hypothetical protein T265_07129 [Opisthorchis viverrini]KER25448.1 hypothetical protein T265_07129 [Opisthorchis viverrini]